MENLVTPDAGAKPFEALVAESNELKTALAMCKMRLFAASYVATNEAADLAGLVAAEATYDGYAAGGVVVTAAGDPYFDNSGSGFLVTLPSVQFNFVATATPVTNSIGGAFVVDAAGKLRAMVRFAAPRPMNSDLASIVVALSFRVSNPA